MTTETSNGLYESSVTSVPSPQNQEHNFVLLTDPKTPQLAIRVGRELKHTVWPGLMNDHNDEERYPKLPVSVRGQNVYIISTPKFPDLHSKIWGIGSISRAVFDSDAKEINAIIPHFPYGRSDKRDEPRITIGGKLMEDFLEIAKINRIVSVALHNLALQSAANDARWITLFSSYSIVPVLESLGLNGKVVVGSADGGRIKEARWFRNYFRANSTMDIQPDVPAADKTRELGDGDNSNSTLAHADYKGTTVILVDDELGSGNTIVKPARDFKRMGAEAVIGVVSSALWTEDKEKGTNAIDTIKKSEIDLLLVTDALEQPEAALALPNVREVSIAPMLAGVIRCIEYHIPVSDMFLKASYREKPISPLYDPREESTQFLSNVIPEIT